MAFKHCILFGTDLAANFVFDQSRTIPNIISKLLPYEGAVMCDWNLSRFVFEIIVPVPNFSSSKFKIHQNFIQLSSVACHSKTITKP